MTIKGCQHLGRTYAPGNVFGKGDSCNQCTCLESGDVQCTDNKCFQGKQKCYKLRHCVITFWKRDMQFYKKQINSWNESTVKGNWVHFLMNSFKQKLSTFAKERTKTGKQCVCIFGLPRRKHSFEFQSLTWSKNTLISEMMA